MPTRNRVSKRIASAFSITIETTDTRRRESATPEQKKSPSHLAHGSLFTTMRQPPAFHSPSLCRRGRFIASPPSNQAGRLSRRSQHVTASLCLFPFPARTTHSLRRKLTKFDDFTLPTSNPAIPNAAQLSGP